MLINNKLKFSLIATCVMITTTLLHADNPTITESMSKYDAFVDRILKGKDISLLSMPERKDDILTAIKINDEIDADMESLLKKRAQNDIALVNWATSCDLGSREDQNKYCQTVIIRNLKIADKLDLETEYQFVSQLRNNRNEQGTLLTGKELLDLRYQLLDFKLHLWRRIEQGIDPSWDPKDLPEVNVGVPGIPIPGMTPDSIKDKKVRKQYEAAIAANKIKSETYLFQSSHRNMRDSYSKQLAQDLEQDYKNQLFTPAQHDIMVEKLTSSIIDENFRILLLSKIKPTK